jgi:queuine tRNA-ribosyltransferase
MNVGTQAAIKGGLEPGTSGRWACQVELSNTYHLHLRPGDRLIKNWAASTDSWAGPAQAHRHGGFQIFFSGKPADH